jgi:hypothetical protein
MVSSSFAGPQRRGVEPPSLYTNPNLSQPQLRYLHSLVLGITTSGVADGAAVLRGYTLGAMAGKPPETPPHGKDDVRSRERTDETERIGPVAVARHVKDDGRALILYTRAVRKRP